MKIIGHRGAAGLAPENSLKSFRIAKNLGLSGIEMDVRVTKDDQLIVCHDKTLDRLAGKQIVVASQTMMKLKKVKLSSGEHLASLDEVLELLEDTPLVIEAKGDDWAKPLQKLLKKYKHRATLRVISFNHAELSKFKNLCPDIELYALGGYNIFGAILAAKRYGFDGIDVRYLAISVAGYYMAKLLKLKLIVYTVNSKAIAKMIDSFFPGIAITSDIPHKLHPLVKEITD